MNVVRAVVLAKALLPIVITEFGMEIELRLVAKSNALLPIDVTPLGILMEASRVLP